MTMRSLVMGIVTLVVPAASQPLAAQTRVGVSLGFNVGSPGYYRPVYGPAYGYGYYRPYPVYVVPRPVFVRPAPIYYEPAPVIIERPVVVQPAPVVRALSSTSDTYDLVPATGAAGGARQAEIERYHRQLSHGDEQVRSEGALALGRLKADQAVDALAHILTNDRSPMVRDHAARALGLIGSPRGLSALTTAAQADSDRDVRRSAQFAVEVIRSQGR